MGGIRCVSYTYVHVLILLPYLNKRRMVIILSVDIFVMYDLCFRLILYLLW